MAKKIFYAVILLHFTFAFSQVTPLISTTWNQGCNYNALMPTVASGGACSKAWTGCNATAMGQIFKYYNYPSVGMNSNCNTNNTSHCVDFSTQTYNYSLMPNNVSSANTEVAKLMYHIGIAVNMQWAGTSSDSFFNAEAFKRYFKYSPQMYASATYLFSTTADLILAIRAELDAGRPVYAKGGNHFYLIDGYNASNQFHCNFGWGGTYDGYYAINNITNGAGNFTPVNFLFSIKPMLGTLEVATQNVNVGAASSSDILEFTSTENWTATADVPWITLNLTSGSGNYFNNTDGSNYTVAINNSEQRIGHITITNGIETKIITVNQEACPLGVSATQFDYNYPENTQTLTTTWFSWSSWNANTSASWITISPNSGTGNATVNITCSDNNTSSNRTGYVYINGGAYSRTITINQEGNILTSSNFEKETISFFPNPTSGVVQMNLDNSIVIQNIKIIDSYGKVIQNNYPFQSNRIDLNNLQNGLYLLGVTTEKGTFYKKIIKE